MARGRAAQMPGTANAHQKRPVAQCLARLLRPGCGWVVAFQAYLFWPFGRVFSRSSKWRDRLQPLGKGAAGLPRGARLTQVGEPAGRALSSQRVRIAR